MNVGKMCFIWWEQKRKGEKERKKEKQKDKLITCNIDS